MFRSRVPIVFLFAVGFIVAGGFPIPSSRGADYDAVPVRLTVPEKVAAHEIFRVEITVRNTGTQSWEGWPIRLRSTDRQDPSRWETDYILIAQGTTVRPGQEYTFRSALRAPGKAGTYDFAWQVCQDEKLWFGGPTPARTIEVVAGAARTDKPIPPPAKTSDGKRILTFDDFEYLGSFKSPQTVGEARGAFSDCGLALRPMSGGRDRLLMNYTHPTQVLFEVEIPELVKVQNGRHDDLSTAEVKRIWGPITLTRPGEEPICPNGGFTWIEPSQTLVWTWYHGYKTGDAPPVLGMTRLSDDGTATSQGPWYITAPDGLYKSYWGGAISLPKPFADRYTDGKTLALGFGGYYSICASASRGPALGAIPPPNPKETSVQVTAMFYSPHDQPAPRDGDYLNANCGFWDEQPISLDTGTWTYDDACRAGTFIDTPTGHVYLAFVRLGTGRLGYDFGTITHAGTAEYWYGYDPKELGEAAAGRGDPCRIRPHSMTRVDYPLGRTVTGACFDSRTGRLYLCLSWAYPDGLESYPVVHVYGVK